MKFFLIIWVTLYGRPTMTSVGPFDSLRECKIIENQINYHYTVKKYSPYTADFDTECVGTKNA